MEQSVPKRRYIKLRRRDVAQKKEYKMIKWSVCIIVCYNSKQTKIIWLKKSPSVLSYIQPHIPNLPLRHIYFPYHHNFELCHPIIVPYI